MGKGKFITFEGGEGAGKSTQIALLAEALEAVGISTIRTREPGGSAGAEQIRELLVNGDTNRWSAMTEALLNYAARRDHLDKTILPALDRGDWVLCDRFSDSTMAYQGYGHGINKQIIKDLHDTATDGIKPDLTLIFDIPVEEGLKRAGSRGTGEDRYERMASDFHDRLRQGFLEIAAHEPDRCALIDATGTIENVKSQISKAVFDRLKVET